MQQVLSILISGLIFWALYSFAQTGEFSVDALRAHSMTAVIFVLAFGLVKAAIAFARRNDK